MLNNNFHNLIVELSNILEGKLIVAHFLIKNALELLNDAIDLEDCPSCILSLL